ncbi:MAG: cupin domain-containing protein [Bacteroidetes bacterium]|nr:MAG: cupin domain-containing protein [Bacteroidota bacterium]
MTESALQSLPFEWLTTDRDEPYGRLRLKTEPYCVELIQLESNTTYTPHYHNHVDASFHFLCGQGDVQIDGQKHSIKKGLILEVPKKCYHGFTTQSQVIFLSIQTSPIYKEDVDDLDLHYA